MFLLDLPHISAFLSTWLTTHEIYKLDKSLKDTIFLSYLQNIISDPYFITYGSEETKKKHGIEKLDVMEDFLFEWLLRRKVHIRALRINELDLNLTLLECRNILSKLDYLHFFYRYRTLPIILSCKDYLKELELVGYESQFDDVIPYISQFKQLKTLKILNCLKTFKKNRSEISKFINNSNTTNSNDDSNLINIPSTTATTTTKLLNLKEFFCYWDNILNKHLIHIFNIAPNVEFIELRDLDRRQSNSHPYHHHSVNEDRSLMLQKMVHCSPNLYSFKIRSCPSFIKAIPYLSKLTHLHILELHFDLVLIETYHNNLSETMLNSLFPSLLSLEILVIRNCLVVTDRTLSVIAASCPNIRKLDLNLCSKITDKGIIKIADSYSSLLEEIKLSSLKLITDQSILRLANYCTKLKSIDISACKNISKSSISAFKFNEVKVVRRLNDKNEIIF